VRVLFVGESPPASGRLFYAANSGLYRAMHEAFAEAFPPLASRDFLPAFCDLSCLLVDLCERPVDRLPPAARRKARTAAEPRLARDLVALDPIALVTVMRAIEPHVARAIEAAGCKAEHLALPYPGRWVRSKSAFIAELRPTLRRWRRARVLDSP
jgi:hypothetical protein